MHIGNGTRHDGMRIPSKSSCRRITKVVSARAAELGWGGALAPLIFNLEPGVGLSDYDQ